MSMTVKEIRETAEGFGPVTNAEKLKEAVPSLIDAYQRVAEMAKCAKVVKRAIDVVAERASNYAIQHPGVFDDGKLMVSPIGVQSGDMTIDGNVYHFAAGFGPIVRVDGETLTQEFLMGLPKEWTKDEMKLDPTAIMTKYGKGEAFASALEEKGLVRSAKNQWSIKVDATTVDGIDD